MDPLQQLRNRVLRVALALMFIAAFVPPWVQGNAFIGFAPIIFGSPGAKIYTGLLVCELTIIASIAGFLVLTPPPQSSLGEGSREPQPTEERKELEKKVN